MECQAFMRKRLLPLNPLRAFEATARYLSISRAASELNVTPGAVSHQIRVLEDELNVMLFERSPGQLKLTAHGLALQPSSSAAFDSIAEASAFVSRQKTGGDLSINCGQALASYWLLPRLSNFTKFYPSIRLKLGAVGDDAAVVPDVSDVTLSFGDGNWPQFYTRLWTHTVLVPVCSPTILNANPLRSPQDLANHTIIHSDAGGEWHRWLIAAHTPTTIGKRHFNLSNTHLAIEAAIHGHGVALCEVMTVAGLIEDGRLMTPFARTIPSQSSFYIVCKNELRNSAPVRAFSQWLAGELSEKAPAEDIPAIQKTPKRARRQ
ncbi:MAG: LysR family transcriptional regulator [Rhodospirillaceae bacterium]|nr:LysR family transcriptional regulator [Rhodospirillaceae bacterium]